MWDVPHGMAFGAVAPPVKRSRIRPPTLQALSSNRLPRNTRIMFDYQLNEPLILPLEPLQGSSSPEGHCRASRICCPRSWQHPSAIT
jgi:hypothetical protein